MFENILIPVAYGERPDELKNIGVTLKSFGVRSICLYHVHESGSFFRASDISWLVLLQEALEEVGLSIEVKGGRAILPHQSQKLPCSRGVMKFI